jgi:hypothetical protein
MTNTPPTTVRIPDTIKDAAREWCEKNNRTVAQAMLEGLLLRIGRQDLADQLPKMGRPKLEAPPPAKKKRTPKR